MRVRTPFAVVVCLGLTLATACAKKDDAEATPSTAPSAQSSSAAARAETEAPAEEDFEEEAERSISADTLETELAKLEKEIS